MTPAPHTSPGGPPFRLLAPLPLGVLALLLLALLTFLATRYLGERRLLEDMPPARRAVLLRSELEAFRLRCGPDVAHRSDLVCRERARALLHFPECDAACKEAVEAYAPAATR